MKRKKRNLKVHFSKNRNDWATPRALFDAINAKYGPFDLDVCASLSNHKVDLYYDGTKFNDGLLQNWWAAPVSNSPNVKCWMNPPYGDLKKWMEKAYLESQKGCRVVCLIPARTDTRVFHDYVMKAKTVLFIKGRVKFVGAETGAPFPSMIVVFEKGNHKPRFGTWHQ